jgi:hypothetical protein
MKGGGQTWFMFLHRPNLCGQRGARARTTDALNKGVRSADTHMCLMFHAPLGNTIHSTPCRCTTTALRGSKRGENDGAA